VGKTDPKNSYVIDGTRGFDGISVVDRAIWFGTVIC